MNEMMPLGSYHANIGAKGATWLKIEMVHLIPNISI